MHNPDIPKEVFHFGNTYDEHEDHKLDRFKVDTVRCRLCNRTQAPSQHCIYCRSIFGMGLLGHCLCP